MRSSELARRWLIALALTALTLGVGAQTLNEVSVERQGDEIVASVSFVNSVRLVQQTPLTPSKFIQFQIEFLGADEPNPATVVSESKRVAATAVSPAFTLVLNTAPNKRQRLMTMQLGKVTSVRARQGANLKTIDIVFAGKAAGNQVSQKPNTRYAVNLLSTTRREIGDMASIPAQFQNYEVFDSRTVVNGVDTFEVNLGYFPTQTDADAARKALLGRFPAAKVIEILPQSTQPTKPAVAQQSEKPAAAAPVAPSVPAEVPQVAVQAVPAPVPAEDKAAQEQPKENAAEVQAVVRGSDETEARATELMAIAKEAIGQGKTETAIANLNQLLLLPPNSASQDAQELIGVAYERSGDVARAKVEYELYLKLFKVGEGSQRVAQRLASMGEANLKPEAQPQVATAPAPEKPSGPRYTGNIAQYYFGGKTRTQSLVSLVSGIDQATLTNTTESALVTNFDLGARYSTEKSDVRAVFRGTGSVNLSETSNNTSILNAAYVDYTNKGTGLSVRMGRQSPINGGLLGMFDGVSLTYPVNPNLRVNLMGGVPANPLVTAPSEQLFAGMVEFDNIITNLNGDIYVQNQTTEGITNRRGIGVEARYSHEIGSLYALVDYDELFHAVNAFSLQGSVQGPGQLTYTLLLDSRKAPSLALTNALISSSAVSLKTLLQLQSLEEIMATAEGTSSQARQILFSVSKPINNQWQASGDLRFSDIGALPAVGNFEATPATGAQYGISAQLTGSNLYSKRDINNFNLSYLSTPFFHGTQIAYNNLTGLYDNKLTVEPSIRLYSQTDAQGAKMMRVTTGLRGSYNVSKRTSVMGETVVEHSTNEGPLNNDTTTSVFFYFGVRYELF